jgi:hypothetical protein
MLEMYTETYMNSPLFLSDCNQSFESFDMLVKLHNIKFNENLFSSYDTLKDVQTDTTKLIAFPLQLFFENAQKLTT